MSGMNPNQMGMDFSQLFQPRTMPDMFKPSSMPWGQQVSQAFAPPAQPAPMRMAPQQQQFTGNGRGLSPIVPIRGQVR